MLSAARYERAFLGQKSSILLRLCTYRLVLQITRTPDESFLAFLLGTGNHALLLQQPLFADSLGSCLHSTFLAFLQGMPATVATVVICSKGNKSSRGSSAAIKPQS
jgi:hypothetical protein